uniref:Uncharacterized protein n=1 Tax=Eutreptiella gymnastica TaxID=73025 RepID=A0A7S1JD61_9EUGL|mmetsp:Transcript_86562/g.150707  ORF Transcript_86562/g.150707 Transcript_86562/m.150707 type:complete len:112 (+) Transcript_86562:227-562(+)
MPRNTGTLTKSPTLVRQQKSLCDKAAVQERLGARTLYSMTCRGWHMRLCTVKCESSIIALCHAAMAVLEVVPPPRVHVQLEWIPILELGAPPEHTVCTITKDVEVSLGTTI